MRDQKDKTWIQIHVTLPESAYTNDQYIWHENNIAQLYFILGRAQPHWNFSSEPKDVPDIYRFSNRKCILNMCSTGNL